MPQMLIKSPAHSTDPKTATHQSSQRGFFAPVVQPRLTVNKPGDSFEQEADAVADQVMRMPDPKAKPTTDSNVETGNVAKAVEVQRFVQPVAPKSSTPTLVQPASQSLPGTRTSGSHPALAPTTIQTKKDQRTQEDAPESEKEPEGDIMRQDAGAIADSASGNPAPPIVSEVLSSGSGQPMEPTTSDFMESRFGQDFSDVRIHTDSRASESAEAINALAYTSGSDIVFGEGQYAPETDSGKHLLAHELTHTVQQGGGVQRREGVVQRTGATPKKDTIRETSSADLEKNGAPEGYIKKGGKKGLQFHIKELKTEKYLITNEESSWLKQGPYLMPRGGTRETKQASIWKGKVREGAKKKLAAIAGIDLNDQAATGKLLKFTLETNQKATKGMVGTLTQLVNELLVPFWNYKGEPQKFEIEHMIDWQVLGPESDKIENLILLESKINRRVGKEVDEVIIKNLGNISTHYSGKYEYTAESGREIKKKYDAWVDKLNFDAKDLKLTDYYYHKEVSEEEKDGNPFRSKFITIKEAAIPANHFLLTTSDRRAAYILPYKATKKRIGAFDVTVEYDEKKKELESVTFKLPIKNEGNSVGVKQDLKGQKLKINKQEHDKYIIQDSEEKALVAPLLKGLFLKNMSPIVINEDDIVINGLDVSVSGKVESTLSIFKGVDISFLLENDEFTINAVVPIDQIGKNIPKPFNIDYANLIIGASSKSGLFIAGGLGFSIEKFGSGEIFAKVNKKGVSFDGNFYFDSKWFNPAEISVAYENGAWSIGGNIRLKEGVVKGIKSAGLKIGYSKGVFSAAGDAELEVPGIDKIKLGAEFDENGGFQFFAGVDLKKMPGIKSGSAQITVMSKGDEGLKLGITGEAEPDFPSIPELNTKLSISYLDGVFEVKTKVSYTKGKFTGTLEVGVTNRDVDEKGAPKQGVGNKPKDVVVFGYGALEVDIFKGNKGMVSLRLTPEKEVLVAGKIHLEKLSPFGDGFDFKKEIAKFPTIQIPIFGVPGVNIFFEISGGAYFTFNWQPLILKSLDIDLKETNINNLESAQIDIKGSVGSMAKAEAYMTITASLGAKVLVAAIKGSLSGSAGIGVEAEAGGDISATWNPEKGLQFKEINARVAVTPYALFRLTGSLKVYLDLWLTTVTLYYKEWVLSEGKADMDGLSLNLQFPIRFNEEGNLEEIGYDKMSVEQPQFSGEQGKKVLSKGINGDEEPSNDKGKVREQIRTDMRNSTNDKDFTPSKYSKAMQKKYARDPEMKAFVKEAIEEEARLMEYEKFDRLKSELRAKNAPVERKIIYVDIFALFHDISFFDIEVFKMQLKIEEREKIRLEEERKRAEQLAAEQKLAEQKAAELKAAQEKAAKEKAAKEKAAKLKIAKEKAAREREVREKEAREKAAQQKGNGLQPASNPVNEAIQNDAFKAQELEIKALEEEIQTAEKASATSKAKQREAVKEDSKKPDNLPQIPENGLPAKANPESAVEPIAGNVIKESPPDIPEPTQDFKTERNQSGIKQQQNTPDSFFQPKPSLGNQESPKNGNEMPGRDNNPSFGSKDLQIEFSPGPTNQKSDQDNRKDDTVNQKNAEQHQQALKYGETPPDAENNTDTTIQPENTQSATPDEPGQLSFAEERLSPQYSE